MLPELVNKRDYMEKTFVNSRSLLIPPITHFHCMMSIHVNSPLSKVSHFLISERTMPYNLPFIVIIRNDTLMHTQRQTTSCIIYQWK